MGEGGRSGAVGVYESVGGVDAGRLDKLELHAAVSGGIGGWSAET